jgi:transcriptional regulator with XRE-family HTH domain
MSKRYSDDKLVELLRRRDLTLAEIAKELGVSASHLSRIARGRRRKDLRDRIHDDAGSGAEAAARLGRRWVKHVLTRHIKVGLEEEGETARKCREYALNQFLAPAGGAPAAGATDAALPPGIDPEDAARFYQWKSRTEGGPDT